MCVFGVVDYPPLLWNLFQFLWSIGLTSPNFHSLFIYIHLHSSKVYTKFENFYSYLTTPQNMLIFNVNGVMCFCKGIIDVWGGGNIDISKVKIRVEIQNFFFWTFKNMYIVILSCMLLENVMQVLPLLMPQVFVNQFFFHLGTWIVL